MHSLLLILSVFSLWLIDSSKGQTPAPSGSTVIVSGTYIVHKLGSYTSTNQRRDLQMPKITTRGDTLSAIVTVKAQAENLLRLNMIQYYNQTVQLDFWIGDLKMKPISRNAYDLYLGETRMGKIENKNLFLDFGKDTALNSAGVQPKRTHVEASRK